MGCISSQTPRKKELSEQVRKKALGVFSKIDVDGSRSIDKAETLKFWKSNFAKLNTKALFDAVDFDKSGQITEDEWIAFWQIVKQSGHTEEEILEEVFRLDNLMEGKAWVQFTKVNEFVRKDKKREHSLIKEIVETEKRRISGELSPSLQKQIIERHMAESDSQLQGKVNGKTDSNENIKI